MGLPASGTRHSGDERGLGERSVAVVAEQEVGHRVVGHEHVETCIVIEVGKGDAHTFPDMRQQARVGRDILERPIAAVPIEAVRQALEDSRMAVDPDPASLVAAEGIRGGCPLHVVHHEKVEMAVVVVVEPAGGHGPLATRDARSLRRILEAAVAAIAQQLVLPHTGDEKVDITVVVVVARGGAHGISDAAHARGRRSRP